MTDKRQFFGLSAGGIDNTDNEPDKECQSENAHDAHDKCQSPGDGEDNAAQNAVGYRVENGCNA